MHPEVETGLEDYLSGSAGPEFESHLAQCASCREETRRIEQISSLLRPLRTDDAMEPPLGFGARVMQNVREQESRSIWSVFRVDPDFARKLAFGSLLSLAILGSYLVTQPGDSAAQADHTPEAVIASHDVSAAADQHLDGMLFTLATYHQ
jgi:anti-sigma factor RsiW